MTAALLAMQDAGFIVGSYAVTFVVIGGFAWQTLRRGRRFADRVDDVDKHWT